MIVYRTECKIDNKFYYGVHNNTKDHYYGSNVHLNRAIKKYGKENFVRRTIMEFDTEEQAYAFEALIVDQLLVDNPNCYNVGLGGRGNSSGGKRSAETRKLISEAQKGRTSPFKGIIRSKIKRNRLEICKQLNIPMRTLRRWIEGNVKPNTNNKEAYGKFLQWKEELTYRTN